MGANFRGADTFTPGLEARRGIGPGERPEMRLRQGDHVFIKNLVIEGQVIEVDTRTIVVRHKKEDGELVEHRFPPEDLEYRPKPHPQ
jgi:hypothetical protein